MSKQAVHLIVYISQAEIQAPDLGREIEDICEVAQRENPRHEITGVLFHENGYFVQAIEGPEAELHQLMDNIKNDPRHTGLQVLIDKEVVRRTFPDWGMRGLSLADHTLFNPETVVYLQGIFEQNVEINDASFVLFLENMINDVNFQQLFA